MSAVGRGRNGRVTRTPGRRDAPRVLRVVPAEVDPPDDCDCPACAEFDPQRFVDELVTQLRTVAAGLADVEDATTAEFAASAFLSIRLVVGDEIGELLADEVIPRFEAQAVPETLAMLLAIGAVDAGRVGREASAAAERLAKAGVTPPVWEAELDAPLTVDGCRRLGDPGGTRSVLACVFHRAGRPHALMMDVDHLDCDALVDVSLLDGDELSPTLEMIRAGAREEGLTVVEEELDPAEFRWQVERALDARLVHEEEPADDLADDFPESLPPDPLTSTLEDEPDDEDEGATEALPLFPLIQARMAALPASDKPKAPHGDGEPHQAEMLDLIETLSRIAGRRAASRTGPRALTGRQTAPKLPRKRKKSDGPAPIYQIKVSLRGAKPPIWRRIEVPADITLTRLHAVLQVAFAWENYHLYVFETPYGDFGRADSELGHRSDAKVSLEQVAPEVGGKLRYTYDFGDGWEHEIVVEEVLDPDPSARYPRCTGGRRAAPPEDCGGIWGYGELVEILGDPTHPEHRERLEWLGLDDATEFDPASFDAKAVTEDLASLR